MQKVIVVTGASSGIGKATALQLIKEGYSVYGAARRVEKMKDIVGVDGKAVAMDITSGSVLDLLILLREYNQETSKRGWSG